ncbi:methyltransferase domain-containing protein [Syncephalis plumigaleata]|nr:methyltransferase domain-containing protein [Syncephalis plumigaleata]
MSESAPIYDTVVSPSLSSLLEKKQFRWLANAHVVDFFTLNHWEKFDSTWREALLPPSTLLIETDCSIDCINTIYDDCIQLAGHWNIKDEWPASLREYIQNAKSLALNHTPEECWPSPPIKEQILYGMNPKKVHEVERLAWIIAELAKAKEIKQIVDLGSGQGYLSRSLAYQYGLNVLAVDADNVQTCGARRYQAQTERHGKGQLIHATHLVTEKSLDKLLAAIHHNDDESTGTTSKKSSNDDTQDVASLSWLLCGLHTCGDLGASSLRLFTEGDAHALVNVGCCYNLLSEVEQDRSCSITDDTTTDAKPGFPLSHWLISSMSRAENGAYLGLTGRHLACQAPSRWSSQVDTLFMVEYCMTDPKGNAPQVGRSGRSPIATFEDYAVNALKRLVTRVPSSLASCYIERVRQFLTTGEVTRVASTISSVDIATHTNTTCYTIHDRCRVVLREFERDHATGRLQVAIFWTLRVLLAPALERLILEDKLAYLRECGHAAWLVALFDPVASPRNLAILSIKQS